jgi:hypothetical protein
MITVCVCGHDSIGHPGDGPCMHATCDCTAWTATPSAEAAARRLYGDEAVERSRARAEVVWEQQRLQMVFTTGRLQADVDHRRAEADRQRAIADLIGTVQLLAAIAVPVLLIIVLLVVSPWN